MKHLRAIFLILPLLLLMPGHGVAIGFCPCNHSFFFNNCSCSVEGTSCSDGDCDHSSHHKSPSQEKEKHDCGNIYSNPSPYFYVTAESNSGDVNFSPLFWVEISLPGVPAQEYVTLLRVRPTRPPPDIIPPYPGFSRPLLI